MRRLLLLVLLAASLLPSPSRAQDAGGGQDRLSLEALTAPQAGDGRGGYRPRSYSGYHRRSYGGGYHRAVYRRYRYARPTYYGRRSVRRAYRRTHYARCTPRPAYRGYGGNPYIPQFYRR